MSLLWATPASGWAHFLCRPFAGDLLYKPRYRPGAARTYLAQSLGNNRKARRLWEWVLSGLTTRRYLQRRSKRPYIPKRPRPSSLVFLVRDQNLGADLASAQGPTGLGKYLQRSPHRGKSSSRRNHAILGRPGPLAGTPARVATDSSWIKSGTYIQPWQVRRASEYMTHAPLGSINSVAGLATRPNSFNFVSPRTWLAAAHFILALRFPGGSPVARRAGQGYPPQASSPGIDRENEPVLSMPPIDPSERSA